MYLAIHSFDNKYALRSVHITVSFTINRLSFGTKRALGCSFFSSGYKAHFDAPVSGDFENITIPLTAFSDCNSDATGEPTRNCTDDKNVCPDDSTLKNIETLSIWGEGALGKVHLEIKSISADGCDA